MFRRQLTRAPRKRLASKHRRNCFRKLIEEPLEPRILLAANGGDRRHLNLAVTATVEYTNFFGSVEAAQDAIEATVAGVNKVFNRELNLQLDLIDNTDIIFGPGDVDDDPFPTGGPGFDANQTLLDTEIGSENYDIGIIFGGLPIGLAHLAGAGIDGDKAKAYTGFTAAEGGPAGGNAIDNALHEMGHQFGAEHTFNGTVGTCGDPGQHNAATAFEPGSGTTLVGYAGICGSGLDGDNVQKNSNLYYHAGSLDQMVAHLEFLDSIGVGTKDVGVNSVPTVDAGDDYTIPADTPFAIVVSGSDADDPSGESLRYTIEQIDTGPQQTLDPFPGDNESSPLFRSFPPAPASNGEFFERLFPQLSDILTNTETKGEYRPTTARDMTFRATVRDLDGGTNGDEVTLTVVNTGAPFVVTSHNVPPEPDDPAILGGTDTTVTWDVAGTTGSGIDTAFVNIWFSADGGKTFPHLLANTANDGSHPITWPNLDTSEARIKIEGDGNIFFDISDADLNIAADPSAAGVTVTNGVFIGEGGTFSPETDTYTLALNTTPSAPISFLVQAPSGTEVSTDGSSFSSAVEFSRSDTSSQTITVRVIDDGKLNGARRLPITHSVSSSSDADYPADLVIEEVIVGIADNETAPLIGVDLQDPRLQTPKNWTEVDGVDPLLFSAAPFPDLIREDGMPSGVTLTLTPSGTASYVAFDLSASEITAPAHQPELTTLDGTVDYVDFGSGPFTVDATWSGLTPGAEYNIYTFAHEGFGSLIINQTVTITGDGISDPPSFVQDSTARTRQFLVNDEVGDDSRLLETFAKRATADGSGEINVEFLRDDGVAMNRIMISGLAIQPVSDDVISSPPAFTKSFSPDSIDVDGTSTLTFTIDNSANSVDATGLAFTDMLPAGVFVAPTTNITNTCGGAFTPSPGAATINFSLGTVSSATSCSLQVDVTGTSAGSFTNTSGALTSSLGDSGTATDTLIVNDLVTFLDYGDAPRADQSGFAASYPTEKPSGASHAPSGLFLGASTDTEADGQPSLAADGDGTDEDGVVFVTSAITTDDTANIASVLVTASAPGKLDAWIDFTRDGDWTDADEQLFATSVDLIVGDNLISYEIPAGASPGDTYARFRVSTAGGLDPGGAADDGEVEDYRITILDGDSGAAAEIDLVVGDVDVFADGSDVTVEHDGQEIFRVPGTAISSHEFLGTDDDNEVRLGNLSSVLSSPAGLIFDGGDGADALTLSGSDQVLDLTDTSLNSLSNLEAIDIIGASPNTLTMDGASVGSATDGTNTLLVIHDEDDTVAYVGGGWDVEDPIFVSGSQRHVLTNGAAMVETINTRPFQNPLGAEDVNHNESFTSLDALLIINFIGRFNSNVIPLPAPTSAAELPEEYFDVNGSETATALDALRVINLLAILANSEEEQVGEQEQGGAVATVLAPTSSAAPTTQLTTALPQFDFYPSVQQIHDVVLKAFSYLPTYAAKYLADLPEQLEPIDWSEVEGKLDTWHLALEELFREIRLI